MLEEKPGATRIIWILPEGKRVKAGEVVCEFDSSAFRDEVKAQKIRYLQAKAWVEQAQALLEVSEISLREYRDGIFPQDLELIRQYVTTCQTERERAQGNYQWSVQAAAKGYRPQVQVKADALSLQQAEMALHEARGMLVRLEKFTGPKLIKSLTAKCEAIRADKLTQESAFQLESDRLKRLEAMVEHCTLRAPRDGIVVYATQTNPWGMVDAQIQEGVTVRETQPIFSVPDPRYMQVKAKVNESKVALIHPGQSALIRVDAFPDHPLRGTVQEITAIPAPVGRASDVKVYFATVKIEEGFDGLRPGLSAEVDFFIGTRSRVTRIPVQAVREVGGQAFAAVRSSTSDAKTGLSWRWVPVRLGETNASHAEVVSGLKPGDQVIAQPEALPAPQPARRVQTASRAEPSPRG
jgi:multidrug resistance efflux pump